MVKQEVEIKTVVTGAGSASAELGKVNSATRGATAGGKNLVGSLLAMSGGLKGVAAAAGVAGVALLGLKIVNQVADWFKLAAKAAFDFTKSSVMMADSFDVMEKRLKALTGSQGEAAAAMEQIKDFAAGTTAQVDELTEAYIAMKPVFGQISNELLLDVANAAAGAGRSIQTIADTFIRLKTGDFGVEQLRKLNIVKADLEDFDVEFDASGKLISSVDEAMTGVQLLIRDRFGDMQTEMATTLTGAVSNLDDIWMQFKDSIGKELLPVINEFIRTITIAIEKAMKAQDLRVAFRHLADAFKENKDVLDDIAELIPSILKLFADLVDTSTILLDKLGELNEEFKEVGDTGESGIARIGSAIENASVPIIAFVALLIEAAQLWEKFLAGDPKAFLQMAAGWLTLGTAPAIAGLVRYNQLQEEVAAEVAGKREVRRKEAYEARVEESIEKWGPRREQFGPITAEEMAERRRRDEEEGRGPSLPKPKPGGKLSDEEAKASAMGLTLNQYRELQAGPEFGLEALEAPWVPSTTPEGRREIEAIDKGEEERKKRQKEQLKQARDIARMLDPTKYIIEGLKSGEMAKAMEDWAINLASSVASQLASKLITSGIISLITGKSFVDVLTGGVFAQHGMYTGSYEGPVMVHKNEVIMPLDTLGAMSTLINRSMMGARVPSPVSAPEAPGVFINVDPGVEDLIDVSRAESVDRGNISLSSLVGVSE